MARPRFKPSAADFKNVELFAAYGAPEDQIARTLGGNPARSDGLQKIVAATHSPDVAIWYSVCATLALAFIIPEANSRLHADLARPASFKA